MLLEEDGSGWYQLGIQTTPGTPPVPKELTQPVMPPYSERPLRSMCNTLTMSRTVID
jgi:hypothetical protein